MAENANDIKIIDVNGVKRIIANAKKLDAETLAAAKQYADTKIEEKKYELPVADENTLGGVKIGSGITKNADGTISIPAKTFKTINGETIEGSGNITIDLGLYKVVSSLPTEGIDENKIYLVQSTETVPDGELNTYVEWVHVGGKWEKLGEYKSAVDLSPYAKTADVTTAIGNAKTELEGKIDAAKQEAISTATAAIEEAGRQEWLIPTLNSDTFEQSSNETTLKFDESKVKIGDIVKIADDSRAVGIIGAIVDANSGGPAYIEFKTYDILVSTHDGGGSVAKTAMYTFIRDESYGLGISKKWGTDDFTRNADMPTFTPLTDAEIDAAAAVAVALS